MLQKINFEFKEEFATTPTPSFTPIVQGYCPNSSIQTTCVPPEG